ncbi:MAG: DUF3352 domain-containing protein [Chloroflexota bacterium]
MTDDFDPNAERPTLENDTTSRVPTGAAPAAPVVTASTPRRSGRARWAVSLAVVALVVVTSIGVGLLITGRSATSAVLGYVPSDAVAYGEVRLDLPGDQRRAVGEFLAKFPGFADQAALDAKLDEVLDQLVKDASNGDQTFTTNIKPWFDGELAFSMGPLPPVASGSTDQTAMAGKLRALVLVSIKDPVAAQAWFDAAIAKTGATTTKETYNGATLTVFAPRAGFSAALALIDGKVAVAGDIVSVRAAVDTKGAGQFAAQAAPKAAIESGTGDHIGFVYVAIRPLLAWSTQMSAAVMPSGAGASPAITAQLLKSVPDWGAYWLRFDRDAVVLQAVTPKPETPLGPTETRASKVVEHIPGSAVVAITTNDLGKTINQYVDFYRTEPAYKPVFEQLDQALGLVGGQDAAIGWAGDSAIVVSVADGTPEGGLIVAPTDKAAADHLFTSLRSLIALGGAQQGITVRDETYNGTKITIIDLGDASRLAGSVALLPVPTPAGHVEIAYATTADVVVIGSGSAFVKHVLDTTAATSLASNDRYKALADRAGSGIATSFVDVTTIRGLIEKAAVGVADGPSLAKYEKDVKPFLAPFDAIFMSSSVSGDLSRATVYVTVK